jgi:CheY-like chemotaxis protein
MGKKKLILFIEDDRSTVEVYKTALEGAGFIVNVILSGQEAIEEIREMAKGKKEKPDLVLLDYVLPDLDGIEILKEIRKDKNTKDIKVFLSSNYSVEELKRKGKLVDGEKIILKADYPPSKMVELIKKELGS